MIDVFIIGSGPAGLGILSCFYRRFQTEGNTHTKICMIDAEPKTNCGKLSNYDIPSDTRASKFLTCLDGLPQSLTSFTDLKTLTQQLLNHKEDAAPLEIVGKFYRVLGEQLCEEMVSRGQLLRHHNTKALSASWHDTYWRVETENNSFDAKAIILACGASEAPTRFLDFLNAHNIAEQKLKSWKLSGEVLSKITDKDLLNDLRPSPSPKVSIIGGSHSAISVAAKLLNQQITFQDSGIKIFHRSPMHVTFDSPEAARLCGFHDFDEDDICPITRRVFALKGFRLDSRKLLMSIKGYGDISAEKRVELIDINTIESDTMKAELESSDIVISALGYEPDYVPLYSNNSGHKFELNAPNFVDSKSRLLDSSQAIIPNCYALGLASNYNLAGRYGEPSFIGQANGLVLWHKDIGMEIVSQLLGD